MSIFDIIKKSILDDLGIIEVEIISLSRFLCILIERLNETEVTITLDDMNRLEVEKKSLEIIGDKEKKTVILKVHESDEESGCNNENCDCHKDKDITKH